jgi:hypothetical protein
MTSFFSATRRGLLTASLVPFFTLAACGSDSVQRPSPAPTPAPTPAPAPAPTPTPSPAPTPTPSAPPLAPAGFYDDAIGAGVDVEGFARLPLRAGAKRYFVNSSTGSDSNSCVAAESPSTPRRTIPSALECVKAGTWAGGPGEGPGAGDQLLVAEGTTYSAFIPTGGLDLRFGHSAMYPTVIQSYDPADALNENKYGRAKGNRRPVITEAGIKAMTNWNFAPNSAFYVVRGFDFNPGDTPNNVISWAGGSDHILMENNIFRYTVVAMNGPAEMKYRHILRHNAFYGAWDTQARAGGFYDDNATDITIENNIFVHSGWRPGFSRDTPYAEGGPTIFNHGVYLQNDTRRAVARRNVTTDSSATGLMMRGDAKIYHNVAIDEPIGFIGGTGNDYNVKAPNGVDIEIFENLVLGDADISTVNPRGQAIITGNGKPGSYVRKNLILHSRNPTAVNVFAFQNKAEFNQPSHILYDNNLVYRYSARLSTVEAFPAQIFSDFQNNVWDAATLGTNTNHTGMNFPNAVVASDVYSHLGCGAKASCVAQMVENPDQNWADRIRSFVFAGYGR